MYTYSVKGGSDIKEVATRVVSLANEHRQPISFTFNGIELIVQPNQTTVEDLLGLYQAELEVDAYLQESLGRDERLKEIEQLQASLDEAMVKLETLDFSDTYNVVLWIESICEAGDRMGITLPIEKILAVFQAQGYEARPVARSEAELNDERVFAAHIIENSLNFLEDPGFIHQIVKIKIEEFKSKFPRNH